MADEHPTDDPALALAARHALHDEELVAAFAADPGEADEDEAARARSFIERCVTCALLATEVSAITGAVRALEPAAAAGIRAPRDFRLTVADAARLNPALAATAARTHDRQAREPERPSVGFLAGLAAFLRPVGATLATFGVVGLLVGTVSLGSLGGSAAMAPGGDMGAPGASAGVGGVSGQQPTPTDETRQEYTPLASGAGAPDGPKVESLDAAGGSSPALLLLLGSALALVLGLALLVLGSRAARRRRSTAAT